MDEFRGENKIVLRGQLAGQPALSHKNNKIKKQKQKKNKNKKHKKKKHKNKKTKKQK